MELPIRSPWLHQLNRKRPATPLRSDESADIAVIGGGIAGIVTAYFLLRDTDKRVILLEADQVAHGATGHNAGQLVAEFERSFGSLVRQFGLPLAAQGLRDIQSAWGLLDQILRDEHLDVPLWRVTGYGALSDTQQVLDYLADSLLRTEAGLPNPRILVAAEWQPGFSIPLKYEGLYEWIPQKELLALCEAKDPCYIALYVDPTRGCMNSALFCEQLVRAMLEKWPQRIRLHEMTAVETVILHPEKAELGTQQHTITASRVVLCTNGFERFRITDDKGADIDTKFHRTIRGTIGYMAAFLEPHDRTPMANWYQDKPGIDPEEPYFYMTRRPYDLDGSGRHNLLGIGGPETPLPEEIPYDRQHPFKDTLHAEIDTWMRKTYAQYSPARTEDAFFWHGLMGYTQDGVRIIGAEPCNTTLMYNLGCNGIGLLPSIFGGKKIATIIAGIPQEPSVFDPRDATCPVPSAEHR